MAELWASLFIFFLLLILTLHVFTLPANWIMLLFILIWKFFHPEAMTWAIFVLLVALSGVAEVIEFLSGAYGAKKYGSTGRGNIGGIIGAIAGAIVGAPFLLGLGAIIGSVIGAYVGCLVVEMGQRRAFADARRAAWGAMWGRFFGLVAKVGIGVFMLALAAPRIWPG
jgi:hypothetical protein